MCVLQAQGSGSDVGKLMRGWKEKNWKEEKRSVCISYEELGNTCRLRNMKMVITVAAGMIFAGPRLYSDGIGKKYRPCRVLAMDVLVLASKFFFRDGSHEIRGFLSTPRGRWLDTLGARDHHRT